MVPPDPADVVTPIDWEYDLPSSAEEQLAWLRDAGLAARVAWCERDLAVLVGERPASSTRAAPPRSAAASTSARVGSDGCAPWRVVASAAARTAQPSASSAPAPEREAGGERAVEGVAGAGGVDGLDRRRGEVRRAAGDTSSAPRSPSVTITARSPAARGERGGRTVGIGSRPAEQGASSAAVRHEDGDVAREVEHGLRGRGVEDDVCRARCAPTAAATAGRHLAAQQHDVGAAMASCADLGPR